MRDRVWPIDRAGSGAGRQAYSYNGIGTHFTGLTRPNRDGCVFGTKWFMFLFPVVPLRRYYMKQEREESHREGLRSTYTVYYRLLGVTPLRVSEIVRTYLYAWVFGPLVVGGPLVLWWSGLVVDSDELGWHLWRVNTPLAIVATFWPYVWFLGALIGVASLLTFYRKRWAPVREPEWMR